MERDYVDVYDFKFTEEELAEARRKDSKEAMMRDDMTARACAMARPRPRKKKKTDEDEIEEV